MKSSSTTIDNISLDRGVRQSRMTSFSGSEVYDVRRVQGSLHKTLAFKDERFTIDIGEMDDWPSIGRVVSSSLPF